MGSREASGGTGGGGGGGGGGGEGRPWLLTVLVMSLIVLQLVTLLLVAGVLPSPVTRLRPALDDLALSVTDTASLRRNTHQVANSYTNCNTCYIFCVWF